MCKNISMSSMRYKYLNLGMSTLEWVIGIGKQNCLIVPSYFLPHFGSCFIIHANLPLATQGLVKCGVVYNKISNIIILPATSIISHFPIIISCPPLCNMIVVAVISAYQHATQQILVVPKIIYQQKLINDTSNTLQ